MNYSSDLYFINTYLYREYATDMVPWYKVQNSCIILDSPFTDQLKPNTRDGRLSELCQKVMIWQHSYDRK